MLGTKQTVAKPPATTMTTPATASQNRCAQSGAVPNCADSYEIGDDDCRALFAVMIEGFALHEIICDESGKPCDYRFLRVNTAFEEILGLKSAEIIGRTVRELFPEIDPWWIKTYGQVALTGVKTRFEHYFPPLKKFFEVTAYSPRRGEFATVFSDITARKEVESDLCASEERYRLVVENCADVLLEVDGERRFLYLSPNFFAIFGYEPFEILGTCVMDLMHPEDRAALMADRPFGGDVSHLVFRHRHKDGSWRWVEMNGREFTTPAGEKRGVGILRDITKARAAEERLRQLSRAVEQSPATVVITDTRGHIEYVNPKFTETTGYTFEEAIGKNPRLLKSGELSAERYKELWKTITSGNEWVGEFHNKKKNGELYWELASISPIFDDHGVITHFVAVKEDITDRKRAEKELFSSREALRAVLDNIPQRVFWKDLQMRYLGCNRSFAQDRGCDSTEEIIGTTDHEMSSRASADILCADDRAVMESNSPKLNYEELVTRLDGIERCLRTNKVPLHDREGGVTGVLGTYEDITEQKRSEITFRENEARFRTICEASPLGIYMLDEKFRMIYANEAGAILSGRTPEELAGTGWRAIIHPEDSEAMDAEWEVMLHTRKPFQARRRYCHKDGKIIWLNVTVAPILDQDSVRGYIGLAQDITERKRVEEQLLRSQRMESIGTLASGVAHDLNNILAPVLMAASILQEKAPADLRSLATAIMESAQRGADIVKQVLTFARGLEGERINLQLRHLIKDVVEISRETFPKSIVIRNRVPKELWMVIGDSTQLHQVLLNLFINARDAMPDGGTLTVTAEDQALDENYAAMQPDAKPGQYVVVSVADSGTGISPGVIDKIFDPFFTTKEVGKGTGLGLSTVIGIVRSHGGFLKVYSEMGKGSTFKVYLPANPGGTPDSIQAKEQPALPMGSGEWILLADDELVIRRITCEMLTRHGYNVLVAADGVDALSIYAQHMREIRVVLTDVMMPLIDGVALTRALKKMNGEVRIIASTGQADDSRRSELEQLGVKEFLIKPYVAEKLLTAIRETIHP